MWPFLESGLSLFVCSLSLSTTPRPRSSMQRLGYLGRRSLSASLVYNAPTASSSPARNAHRLMLNTGSSNYKTSFRALSTDGGSKAAAPADGGGLKEPPSFLERFPWLLRLLGYYG